MSFLVDIVLNVQAKQMAMPSQKSTTNSTEHCSDSITIICDHKNNIWQSNRKYETDINPKFVEFFATGRIFLSH